MNTQIEITNLSKEFDQKMILNHISLTVQEGEVIGLLGANGAGKTTLLKLLSGLLEPTDGGIHLLGQNPWDNRDKVLRELGILIETPVFYEHLTAHENLDIHLDYMNSDANIDEVLKLVGLQDVKGKIGRAHV